MDNIATTATRVCIVKYIALLLSTFLAMALQAAEVDQFTHFGRAPLNDSADLIDAEVERRIDLALQLANSPYPRRRPYKVHPMRKRPRCDEQRLYDSLRWYLARPVIGQVETFAETAPDIDRRRVDFKQSIYRDFPWQQSPSLVLSERLAAVIRIGNVEIGSDKLGHFFTEGASYFEITRRLSDSIESGLLFGDWSESLYFGAQTTGVFSFADLVANFNGLRFWNRILGRQPDPLTGVIPKPFIECRQKRWQRVADVHMVEYVDNGWDESINCVAVRNETLLQRLQHPEVRCRPRLLPKYKYQQLDVRLLNRAGLTILAQHLQPEVILPQRVELQNWSLPTEAVDHIREVREWLERWRLQALEQTP